MKVRWGSAGGLLERVAKEIGVDLIWDRRRWMLKKIKVEEDDEDIDTIIF